MESFMTNKKRLRFLFFTLALIFSLFSIQRDEKLKTDISRECLITSVFAKENNYGDPKKLMSPNNQIDPKKLLNDALTTMGRATSYHARAEILIGKQKATIEGDFGVGKVDFTILRFDGKQTKHIIVHADAFISSDNGKTWEKDVNSNGAGLSNLVTAPVSPNLKLADQGPVKIINTEMIEGSSTTHVQVQAQSPVDIWIGDDSKLGKVVRKIHLVASADDTGNLDTTVIYSNFDQPLNIKIPK
jgi:hypothetical protein